MLPFPFQTQVYATWTIAELNPGNTIHKRDVKINKREAGKHQRNQPVEKPVNLWHLVNDTSK